MHLHVLQQSLRRKACFDRMISINTDDAACYRCKLLIYLQPFPMTSVSALFVNFVRSFYTPPYTAGYIKSYIFLNVEFKALICVFCVFLYDNEVIIMQLYDNVAFNVIEWFKLLLVEK